MDVNAANNSFYTCDTVEEPEDGAELKMLLHKRKLSHIIE